MFRSRVGNNRAIISFSLSLDILNHFTFFIYMRRRQIVYWSGRKDKSNEKFVYCVNYGLRCVLGFQAQFSWVNETNETFMGKLWKFSLLSLDFHETIDHCDPHRGAINDPWRWYKNSQRNSCIFKVTKDQRSISTHVLSKVSHKWVIFEISHYFCFWWRSFCSENNDDFIANLKISQVKRIIQQELQMF